MDRIAAAYVRLEQAGNLPAVLDAAYDAFEDMLPVIEAQEDRRGAAFAAFVLSGAAAANGRDALAAAPALRPAGPGGNGRAAGDPPAGVTEEEAATAVAGLGRLLASRLTNVAARATDPADRAACAEAARHAASIVGLLTGAPRP